MSRKLKVHYVKVTLLVLLIMAALATAGLASALWREDLYIIGRVETAVWRQAIGSFKVVKPVGYDENRSIIGSIENGGQTLTLACANVSSGWRVWIGLVIQNVGNIPTTVESPVIRMSSLDVESFNVEVHVYGPYDRGDFTVVWGGVKIDNLPFEGSKNPGDVVLMPNQKAVVWIGLRYDQELIINEVLISITLQYTI